MTFKTKYISVRRQAMEEMSYFRKNYIELGHRVKLGDPDFLPVAQRDSSRVAVCKSFRNGNRRDAEELRMDAQQLVARHGKSQCTIALFSAKFTAAALLLYTGMAAALVEAHQLYAHSSGKWWLAALAAAGILYGLAKKCGAKAADAGQALAAFKIAKEVAADTSCGTQKKATVYATQISALEKRRAA